MNTTHNQSGISWFLTEISARISVCAHDICKSRGKVWSDMIPVLGSSLESMIVGSTRINLPGDARFISLNDPSRNYYASVSCIHVSCQPLAFLFYYRMMKLPLWPLFHHTTSFYFKQLNSIHSQLIFIIKLI